jgi:hypothetical protein
VKAAIIAAQAIPKSRISIQAGSEGVSTVATVLAAASSKEVAELVQYTVTDPHEQYASCDCIMATQLCMCEHQLAVLLHMYPGPRTPRILLEMLGTRFSMPGGCAPHGLQPLQPLVDKLTAANSTETGPQASATAAAPQQVRCQTDAQADHELTASTLPPLPQSAALEQVQVQKRTEARLARIQAGAAAWTTQLQQMQEMLQSVADVDVQESLYRETCQSFQHLSRRYHAITAGSCNPVLPCHIPAGQVSQRAKDALEMKRKRQASKQGSKENEPLPNLAIQPGPGKQGEGNVWKRNKGLRGVLSDLCSSADNSSQLQHAAPEASNEQRLQAPPPQPPPLQQQQQQEQRLKPLLLPVKPREHLPLLQSVLLEKDRRRVETAMAAGYTIPASSLAFPQYSQPQVQQQAQQRELGGQQSVVAVPVNRPRLLAPQPQLPH